MIGLLPFAILIIICLLVLLVWLSFRAIAAVKKRSLIPVVTLVSLISVLGIIALILRVVIALTIGLEHSRAPFEYTRWYGLACLVLVFVLPSVIILAYHFNAKSRK